MGRRKKLKNIEGMFYSYTFVQNPSAELIKKAIRVIKKNDVIRKFEIKALQTEEKSFTICSAMQETGSKKIKQEVLAQTFVFSVYSNLGKKE
jgi:ribosome-interacting GTPase 1